MRASAALFTVMLAGASAAGQTMLSGAERYPALVEYLPAADAAFLGVVEIGGVNRALFRVEKNLGCPLPPLVLVEGFNTADVNCAHYRVKRGDRRLVAGYSLDAHGGNVRVLVPSPHSGCFPVSGDRVVVSFYEGGAPVSCGVDVISSLIRLAVAGDAGFRGAIAELLESPRLEDRYSALALACLAGPDMPPRLPLFLEDHNPVMREAAALSLIIASDDPAKLPDPAALDAGAVSAALKALVRRLEKLYGVETAPWAPLAAAYAGRALDLIAQDKTLSVEMRSGLDASIDHVFRFLAAAAPFSTEGVSVLLAYPGRRAAALHVLASSGDLRVLPLALRYLEDADFEVATAAVGAFRKITGDVAAAYKRDAAPFLSAPQEAARERLRRIAAVRRAAQESRGWETSVRVSLLCGNRAIFYVAPFVLAHEGDLSMYDYYPWDELAWPAVLPHAALGGLAVDSISRASVLEGLGLLVRRFPPAAPWLRLWAGNTARRDALTARYYALKALKELPSLSRDDVGVVLSALGADELDLRLTAADCARRHGLPLLDYRAAEDPDRHSRRLPDIRALWQKLGPPPGRTIPAETSVRSAAALWDESALHPPADETAYAQAREIHILLARGDAAAIKRIVEDASPASREVRLAAMAALATLSLEAKAGAPSVNVEKIGALEAALAILGGLIHDTPNASPVARRAAVFSAPELVLEHDTGDYAKFRFDGLVRAADKIAPDVKFNVLSAHLDTMTSDAIPGGVEAALQAGGGDARFWAGVLTAGKTSSARRLAARVLAAADIQAPAAAARKALDDTDAAVVYETCRMIEKRRIAGCADKLLDVASGFDTSLRYAALRALAAAGGQPSEKAAQALGRIDDFTAHLVEPVVAIGGTAGRRIAEEQVAGTLWRARYFAVLGLAGCRERWAKEMLLELLLDMRERLALTAEQGVLFGEAPELMLDAIRRRAKLSPGSAPEVALLVHGLAAAGFDASDALGDIIASANPPLPEDVAAFLKK